MGQAPGAITLKQVKPSEFGDSLSAPPMVDIQIRASLPGLLRRWQSVAPLIDQPPLDHHYISLHLGGAKRLNRRGEGGSQTRDVASGAYSVTPAGSAYLWDTEGPIDFVHLYVSPATLDQVVLQTFDRDPRNMGLHDVLGGRDGVIESLMTALVREVSRNEAPERLYVDELMQLLTHHLLREASNVQGIVSRAKHALAPFRLRRAIEFIEARLAEPVSLDEIAAAAGVGPFHFSRAFRLATGTPPYAFLIERRLKRAAELLAHTDGPLASVARDSGFQSYSHFSRLFAARIGCSPSAYRSQR